MKNAKQRAITDLNAPNGSRDIPFQSQEFGQDGYRHFVGFQPHFHLNMTQCCKTMKMKVQYLRSLLFDLFETLQAVRTWQRNFASFKFRCHGNQNQNYCLLLKSKRSIVQAKVMFKK